MAASCDTVEIAMPMVWHWLSEFLVDRVNVFNIENDRDLLACHGDVLNGPFGAHRIDAQKSVTVLRVAGRDTLVARFQDEGRSGPMVFLIGASDAEPEEIAEFVERLLSTLQLL